MECQYSTRGLVSSGKHKTPSEAGVEGQGSDTLGGVTCAQVIGGYSRPLDPPPKLATTSSLFVTFGEMEEKRGMSWYHKGLCPLNSIH